MTKFVPRIVGTLIGDVAREPSARTKYYNFLEAVRQRFPLIGVHNAELRGLSRLINALQTLHPDWGQWRERFHNNVPAFRARSKRIASRLKSLQGQADVVLQIGVLFDARWNDLPLPSVIYTDYTSHLSAQKPAAGRSPFTPRQLEQRIVLEHQAFQRAAHICTRSEFVRTSIITDYCISPERVTAIGGGVTLPALPELMPKTNGKKPTILFIGKDFYRKGGDLVLRAFARCRSQLPEARLLFLTKDRIPSYLPLGGVEVIDPTWERSVIKTLYRRADLFVLPSRLETWGDVLLEAMAYGLSCISVSDEPMGEIIDDGVTGIIVPPEDITALADAMIYLLQDENLRYQWGQAARRKVETKFTWDHVVDRLAPIIDSSFHLYSQTTGMGSRK